MRAIQLYMIEQIFGGRSRFEQLLNEGQYPTLSAHSETQSELAVLKATQTSTS